MWQWGRGLHPLLETAGLCWPRLDVAEANKAAVPPLSSLLGHGEFQVIHKAEAAAGGGDRQNRISILFCSYQGMWISAYTQFFCEILR